MALFCAKEITQKEGEAMLKIAICDDEKYYRDQIHALLSAYLEARGECSGMPGRLVLFFSRDTGGLAKIYKFKKAGFSYEIQRVGKNRAEGQ